MLGDLDEAGIAVSDRRLRAADKIARASALMHGNAEVEPIDLEALQFVLWTTPETAATAAQKIVVRANPVGARLDSILMEVDEITSTAVDTATRLDAAVKLEAIFKEAKALADKPGANERSAKLVRFVKNEMTRQRGLAMGLSADKVERLMADE
jgi:hypothetical protein